MVDLGRRAAVTGGEFQLLRGHQRHPGRCSARAGAVSDAGLAAVRVLRVSVDRVAGAAVVAADRAECAGAVVESAVVRPHQRAAGPCAAWREHFNGIADVADHGGAAGPVGVAGDADGDCRQSGATGRARGSGGGDG